MPIRCTPTHLPVAATTALRYLVRDGQQEKKATNDEDCGMAILQANFVWRETGKKESPRDACCFMIFISFRLWPVPTGHYYSVPRGMWPTGSRGCLCFALETVASWIER